MIEGQLERGQGPAVASRANRHRPLSNVGGICTSHSAWEQMVGDTRRLPGEHRRVCRPCHSWHLLSPPLCLALGLDGRALTRCHSQTCPAISLGVDL